jgi:hypothetical protein
VEHLRGFPALAVVGPGRQRRCECFDSQEWCELDEQLVSLLADPPPARFTDESKDDRNEAGLPD